MSRKPAKPAASMALPFGARAVMEGTAGTAVAGDDPVTALYRSLSFFPTPPWAARACAELIRLLDPAARTAWEPGCGQGHFAGPLAETFAVVRASDVHDYGFGQVHDFLTGEPNLWCAEALAPGAVDWVISNPPFPMAEAFIERGLQVAGRGVAMLCRLPFVETVGRYPLMRRAAVIAPFSERVPMHLGRWEPDGDTMTSCALFVFLQPSALADCPFREAIEACWAAEGSLIRLIRPGQCERLTREDDRVVYAGEASPGLLDMMRAG